MRLVDDDEVEGPELGGALVDGLDAGDDDGLVRVAGGKAGGIDADRDARAEAVDLVGILLQQLLHVRENEDAPAPERDGVGRDAGEDEAFAAGGRDHDTGVRVLRLEMMVDGLDGLELVGAEVHGRTTPG